MKTLLLLAFFLILSGCAKPGSSSQAPVSNSTPIPQEVMPVPMPLGCIDNITGNVVPCPTLSNSPLGR